MVRSIRAEASVFDDEHDATATLADSSRIDKKFTSFITDSLFDFDAKLRPFSSVLQIFFLSLMIFKLLFFNILYQQEISFSLTTESRDTPSGFLPSHQLRVSSV